MPPKRRKIVYDDMPTEGRDVVPRPGPVNQSVPEPIPEKAKREPTTSDLFWVVGIPVFRIEEAKHDIMNALQEADADEDSWSFMQYHGVDNTQIQDHSINFVKEPSPYMAIIKVNLRSILHQEPQPTLDQLREDIQVIHEYIGHVVLDYYPLVGKVFDLNNVQLETHIFGHGDEMENWRKTCTVQIEQHPSLSSVTANVSI